MWWEKAIEGVFITGLDFVVHIIDDLFDFGLIFGVMKTSRFKSICWV
jgi:hypothetical protein